MERSWAWWDKLVNLALGKQRPASLRLLHKLQASETPCLKKKKKKSGQCQCQRNSIQVRSVASMHTYTRTWVWARTHTRNGTHKVVPTPAFSTPVSGGLGSPPLALELRDCQENHRSWGLNLHLLSLEMSLHPILDPRSVCTSPSCFVL